LIYLRRPTARGCQRRRRRRGFRTDPAPARRGELLRYWRFRPTFEAHWIAHHGAAAAGADFLLQRHYLAGNSVRGRGDRHIG